MKKDDGYHKLTLKNKNKNNVYVNIHRLVAHVFVKGRTNKRKYVNHIDEVRNNNYYKNLEWVTKSENTIHSVGKKVHQIDIKTNEIINTFRTIKEAYEYLRKEYNNINNTASQISYACKGKQKLAFGFKWSYVN